jgi:hypothetical protein
MSARAVGGWLVAVLVASGCNCFAPVEEVRPDSGVDAGFDGGIDGGVDGGCARAIQCRQGPQPTSGWCGPSPDAGFSCVERACVWECPLGGAGRTCGVNMGSYCLECGDAGTACPLSGTCGAPSTVGSASVEPGSTCTTWPGTGIPFTDVTLMRTASAQCRYMISQAAGAQGLGELWRLDDGSYLTYFPGFGGWCTGRSAFTGAPRSIFNCPKCQFVLLGFE